MNFTLQVSVINTLASKNKFQGSARFLANLEYLNAIIDFWLGIGISVCSCDD